MTNQDDLNQLRTLSHKLLSQIQLEIMNDSRGPRAGHVGKLHACLSIVLDTITDIERASDGIPVHP